jgi:cellulose synthase/poly-beta-1,6-N-acetylglucosamine synthase-like glycosyltransferase
LIGLEISYYGVLAVLAGGYTVALVFLLLGAKVSKPLVRGKLTPTVAVVIPTYNEGGVIERKLENVRHLEYPRDRLRVVVVDSASTDDTAGLVKKFVAENSDNVSCTLLEQPFRMGKSEAINEALRQTDSEILVLTDADVTFPPSSLYELVAGFQDPKVGAVSGVEIPVGGKDVMAGVEGDYRRIYTAIRMAEASVDTPFMCESELSAYRRKLVQPLRLGTMCDDIELTVGLRSQGFRAEYDLSASFFEAEAGTFSSKLRHKFRRGMANQHALLRNWRVLFNRRYGKYGTLVYPFEFFTHLVSPILIVVASGLLAALALTNPALLIIPLSVTVVSAFPSLVIVQKLIQKYNSEALATVRRTGSWIFAAMAFMLFQPVLLASLIRLVVRGPVIKWGQIAETRGPPA